MNVRNAKKTLAPALLLGALGLGVMGPAGAQDPQYRSPYGGDGRRVFQGARPNQARPDFRGARDFGGSGLRWEGDVDDTTIVYVHRRDVRTQTESGKSASNVRARVFGWLPDRSGDVFLRGVGGRGRIRVVQQPGPENDWTAAVRLRDPQPGRGHYVFELGWSSDGGPDGTGFRGRRAF